MTFFHEKIRLFAVELFKINAIKFGEFKTKAGLMTPVYCDLRLIVSYPKLLETLAELIEDYVLKLPKYDLICGVPYTALPIATVVSVRSNIPMVMKRKKAKDYGTKKLIEGSFKPGDYCLIIEDVVTSGSSIMETVKDLKSSGIECSDAIVLLNREQGGADFLKQNGIQMHALLTLTELMMYLQEEECVSETIVEKVKGYLRDTQVELNVLKKQNQLGHSRLKLSFMERVKFTKNPISKRLLEIMDSKKTNLCVAADLTKSTNILKLAEEIGPHICLFKIHIDILDRFDPNFLKNLQDIAERHNFVVFEDRKFADISKIVQLQYGFNLFEISSLPPLVTVNTLMGKGVLDGLRQSEDLAEKSVFLLAEPSHAKNFIEKNYTRSSIKLAKEYPEVVSGIVCQSPLFLDDPGFIQLTSDCHLESIGDNLSQQYDGPEAVVLEKGADVAVVGTGVTKAADPATEALKYRDLLWKAYEKRISVD